MRRRRILNCTYFLKCQQRMCAKLFRKNWRAGEKEECLHTSLEELWKAGHGHIHTCAHTHAYMHIHNSAHTNTCTHIHKCAHLYIYIHTCAHTHNPSTVEKEGHQQSSRLSERLCLKETKRRVSHRTTDSSPGLWDMYLQVHTNGEREEGREGERKNKRREWEQYELHFFSLICLLAMCLS